MNKVALAYNDEPVSDVVERWSEIRDLLIENKSVEVSFTKVDGTERTMFCTLNEAVLPPSPLTESTVRREPNHNVLTVWDVEKDGWRSFRVDGVKSVTISDVS